MFDTLDKIFIHPHAKSNNEHACDDVTEFILITLTSKSHQENVKCIGRGFN